MSKRNGEGAIPSLSRQNMSGEGSTPSVTSKWEGEGVGPPCCAEMPTERVAPPLLRRNGCQWVWDGGGVFPPVLLSK